MEQEFLHQGINQARNANYKMAIALFDRAIASSSRVSQAYYHRGLAYYDWGNIDRAIVDYDRSLNLNPQQVEVYFSRATAFLAQENIQSSIIDLQIIFSLDSDYDKAYKLRANICIRLKEYNQAIYYLKQAGKYISLVKIRKVVVFVSLVFAKLRNKKLKLKVVSRIRCLCNRYSQCSGLSISWRY